MEATTVQEGVSELNSNMTNVLAVSTNIYKESFTAQPNAWLGKYGFTLNAVSITASDAYAPPTKETNSDLAWWNVLTFGISNRCCQVAFYGYQIELTSGIMYARRQQDNAVSNWVQIK